MPEDINKQIGRLEAHVEDLQKSVSEISIEIKAMSAQINRWRGGGAILMIVGVAFGFLTDTIYKFFK